MGLTNHVKRICDEAADVGGLNVLERREQTVERSAAPVVDFQKLFDNVAAMNDKLTAIDDDLVALRSEVQLLTRSEPLFYTVVQFARLTGWKASTIREWCHQRKLKAKYCPRKHDK